MPAADLPTIPSGTTLSIDANIFYYAFLRMSPQCMALLDRCAREDVLGVSSVAAVSELTHRLMLAEAFQKGMINRANAGSLKGRHAVIRALEEYWGYVARIAGMNILLLEAGESLLPASQAVRSQCGLMTNDSMIVAAMDEYAIASLATNDADFRAVSHLSVYQPTDI